jgi:O-Antigen ligase
MDSVMPASTLTLPRLRRLALVGSLPVAGFLGYFVAMRGPWAAGAVLTALFVAALLAVSLNRLHLALLPLAVLAPVAGYLIVLRPEAGFSLIFDGLAVLPFGALILRWLVRPTELDLFSGPQLLVWGFLFVALFQFVNPDGTTLTVTLHGLRRMVVPMLLFFVGFHLDLSEPGRLRRLAMALMLTGWIPVVWGLEQHFAGLTAAEEQYAKTIGSAWIEQQVRIFSTLPGPWAFAAYGGGLALIMFSLAVSARGLAPRLLALAGCALATTALVFTYVRGCLLGYLTGLLWMLVTLLGHRLGLRRVFGIFAAVCITYVVSAVVLGPLIVQHVSADSVVGQRALRILAPMRDFAIQARLVTWNTLSTTATQYPLGVGLGSTAGVSARFQSQLSRGAVHSDNTYGSVLLETGWLGALLFVAIVIHTLITGVRSVSATSTRRDLWVRRGGVAFLIMIAVASVATPVAFDAGASQLYWLVSGIIARPLPRPWRTGPATPP